MSLYSVETRPRKDIEDLAFVKIALGITGTYTKKKHTNKFSTQKDKQNILLAS
jgi:hypothetical protein